MMPNIGPLEIAIVVVIALLVFGPKRLPELGSSMGRGIRGFGQGLKGDSEDSSPELKNAPEEATLAASLDTASLDKTTSRD